MNKSILTLLLALIVAVVFSFPAYHASAEGIPHGGDILYTKPLKSVLFSHKLHVEEKGLGCEMCHMKLFDMKSLSAQEQPDFNMNSLYKGKYCGACHDGKTAFASSSQCARCHGGVKEANTIMSAEGKEKPAKGEVTGPKEAITIGQGETAVKFNHSVHTGNFSCGDCHAKLFILKKGANKIAMNDIYQGKFCGACHDGKKAFASSECSKCHAKTPAPKAPLVYKPQGVGIVSFSHSSHISKFACSDCHTKLFVMKKGKSKMNMDAMYTGGFCGKCHNGTKASAVTECAKCHKGS